MKMKDVIFAFTVLCWKIWWISIWGPCKSWVTLDRRKQKLISRSNTHFGMYVYSERDENTISNFGNETRKQVNKFCHEFWFFNYLMHRLHRNTKKKKKTFCILWGNLWTKQSWNKIEIPLSVMRNIQQLTCRGFGALNDSHLSLTWLFHRTERCVFNQTGICFVFVSRCDGPLIPAVVVVWTVGSL